MVLAAVYVPHVVQVEPSLDSCSEWLPRRCWQQSTRFQILTLLVFWALPRSMVRYGLFVSPEWHMLVVLPSKQFVVLCPCVGPHLNARLIAQPVFTLPSLLVSVRVAVTNPPRTVMANVSGALQ